MVALPVLCADADEEILTFPPDSAWRRQLQPASGRRHPGKLNLHFLDFLLRAYVAPRSRLLDPLAGCGSLLLATLPPFGCTVVLNELEPTWAAEARATWAHLQGSLVAPTGRATIRQGDARTLSGTPVDCLLTSPPYADALGPGHVGPALDRLLAGRADGGGKTAANGHNYNTGGSSLLRPEPTYDALITSPPYLDTLSPQRHADDFHPERQAGHWRGQGGDDAIRLLRRGYDPQAGGKQEANPAQIGNLAGKRYAAAMQAVWQACVPLVRPGGLVIAVVKNIVRDGLEVDLVGQTGSQLENFGLIPVATHWRAVRLGPFHAIRRKAKPNALIIDREGALVLRVPPAGGTNTNGRA